jgi:hypothetical protein
VLRRARFRGFKANRLCRREGVEVVLLVKHVEGGWEHCKRRLSFFPSPAGMSLTKLLARNNLQIPGQGEFG